ncbi:hypothetical protein SAMN05421767_1322 [Granulicatella balaenopterae]|uniref:Uncharacterized protein n=1 Tax=Granulicatella balaenopterae TaxID=137733 RepID=A0A1H9MY23_9LACT|nr:hypothetical protein [Granulicatella balaenopterae]SER28582.1 hypothetical protein SAMN05421767_1322 [Granulicatella balaenopterae]
MNTDNLTYDANGMPYTPDGKKIIKIQLEILDGPIWFTDPATLGPDTEIDFIDNDPILIKYNRLCNQMFAHYYECNSHEQACWFNEQQEKADKEIMLEYITIIINRLNELNDGSYIIDDCETERLNSL